MNLSNPIRNMLLAAAVLFVGACASSSTTTSATLPGAAPSPDPRVGLRAGLHDAAEAVWNMRVLSKTPSPDPFSRSTNSDLAFLGKYAIQGNYSGYMMWDISNPAAPVLAKSFVCPASQSDVSVYGNLLFLSGEDLRARIDCGTQGIPQTDSVSTDRLRGIRIFDISDINNPKNVGNVQTCRGSHTHSLLVPTNDNQNIYIYVSGSSGVRSPSELPGCIRAGDDPNTALFRIEVIKVPLNNPSAAAIVSSPRIFEDLKAPPEHGEAPEDIAAAQQRLAQARARGAITAKIFGNEQVLPPQFYRPWLDSIMKARGGTGTPTAADTAALRASVQKLVDDYVARNFQQGGGGGDRGPTQCHDITLYPEIGRAGGACEGYGMLIDIRDPVIPVLLTAVADSNFSYWHSATFNNDGSKVLFSDEWGGGGGPKCRVTDRKEWGANAIFTINGNNLQFQSYYKLPAAQTPFENCVAHNGSLIPIPGRDVMVQAWYQGGISVFDWTDAAHPKEIAFFDRGPVDSTRLGSGGSWSAYWYNGVIVSSEISRGLDIMELTPSAFISQNEIDAAKSVRFDYYNVQGQQKFEWPASFALARSFVDQLERARGLTEAQIKSIRDALAAAEAQSGQARSNSLARLGTVVDDYSTSVQFAPKVRMLSAAVKDLATR